MMPRDDSQASDGGISATLWEDQDFGKDNEFFPLWLSKSRALWGIQKSYPEPRGSTVQW